MIKCFYENYFLTKMEYTLYCSVVVRLWYTGFCLQRKKKQELIPVGCVPSAAVAVWWRGAVSGRVSARQPPFCEQIDRRLWKHYLVGTTLRTVIKAFERKLFVVTRLFNTWMIAVQDFGLEKYVRCEWVLVVTELVVSGTQCNLVWIGKMPMWLNMNVILNLWDRFELVWSLES